MNTNAFKGLISALFPLFLFQPASAQIPVPHGKRLKQIVKERYPAGSIYIGGTTEWKKLKRGSGIVLDREFNYVTPENSFKQSVVHPSPGKWNWKYADLWVRRAKIKGQVLRVHGPISPQCSRWAKEDMRTAAELERNMTEFMTALCRRYDAYPHVKWIDVVNETVSVKGKWVGPKRGVEKWENPWVKIGVDKRNALGVPNYIVKAFRIAKKNAPNKLFIYNQHGDMQPEMWERVKRTILYLRKKGLRVDGIGWQAHIDVGWERKSFNKEYFRKLIRWAHTHKLSFHVTENNVWLKGEKKDYKAQAKTFGTILRILLEERHGGVVTWNVWNLSDGDQWVETRDFNGCIFTNNFRPKPAYYALQNALIKAAQK